MKSLSFNLSFMVTLCIAVVLTATPTRAQEWTSFRGTRGLGTANAKNLPVTWDSNTNILWKRMLPGPGGSTPIVLGSRIFLTCYSGYAESIESPGDIDNLTRHVVCLDKKTGEVVWEKPFKPCSPESKYRPGNDSRHGYASSTPTTDGERLYVFFGASGVYCLDLDGNQIWHASVGEKTHGWGSGTSPRLYKNLVIVNASIESKSLIALDKLTGKEVWRVTGIARSWSSPMLVDVGGKQEIVLSLPHKLAGFDPQTGKELWYCEGIPDGYVCPSVISHGDVVYVIGGRKRTAIAVRAGGRGEVDDSHVLWTTGKGSNVSSPVYLNGYLYWFHDSNGLAYCLDAKTGEVVYEERLQPRPGRIYSSVTAADGKLYAVSQDNGAFVLAASPEFKLLAVNQFDDDTTRVNASIVVVDNRLIQRTDRAIYCIGQ